MPNRITNLSDFQQKLLEKVKAGGYFGIVVNRLFKKFVKTEEQKAEFERFLQSGYVYVEQQVVFQAE
jgi:hypothetical protein